jgi:hypothetical protein
MTPCAPRLQGRLGTRPPPKAFDMLSGVPEQFRTGVCMSPPKAWLGGRSTNPYREIAPAIFARLRH